MRERIGQMLKIACIALAALLLYQLVRTAFRINPLARVTIPALPTLALDTNVPATGVPTAGPVRSTTNSPGTNSPVMKAAKVTVTNFVAGVSSKSGTTNADGSVSPSQAEREPVAPQNSAMNDSTNSPRQGQPKAKTAESNPISIVLSADTTNLSPVISATNLPTMMTAPGTNVLPSTAAIGTNAGGTNRTSKLNMTNSPSSKTATAGMNLNPAMMSGASGRPSAVELPPEIKARVDRIYESELFGQIMRPQPMALQGIAGGSAFLRSPSGQTGLVKEGDSLGEIKLLRIGINRVLVEQDGKKSELTIFDGYGGESLMPKDKETPK